MSTVQLTLPWARGRGNRISYDAVIYNIFPKVSLRFVPDRNEPVQKGDYGKFTLLRESVGGEPIVVDSWGGNFKPVEEMVETIREHSAREPVTHGIVTITLPYAQEMGRQQVASNDKTHLVVVAAIVIAMLVGRNR